MFMLPPHFSRGFYCNYILLSCLHNHQNQYIINKATFVMSVHTRLSDENRICGVMVIILQLENGILYFQPLSKPT